MNQTKKRLQIINLAISITDIETIQLQILKLASLRSDPRLQEIITGLQAQNYAQTQALITKYIETPTEEIVQRTPQNDQEIIDQFDLFVTVPEAPKEEETELFDFDTLVKEPADQALKNTEKQKESEAEQQETLDDLLSLTAEDIMPGNIDLDISHTAHDDFFDTPVEDSHTTKASHIDTDFIPRDDFFDTLEEPKEEKTASDHQEKQEANELPKNIQELEVSPKRGKEEIDNEAVHEEAVHLPPKEENIPAVTSDESLREKQRGYKPIPYIDQKLKNMLTQYPPLHESHGHYESVNNWLLKISNEGYTEKEVEEVLSHIQKRKENNDIAEAAQLLLICGATESQFAQFILARELFKGELLEKNLPEAFTLINRLAMDDNYPEAICDLAQFYENGVGIGKDRKRAEILYKEAMELGVKRAASHYERLHSANKGLLGKLFGK